MADFRDQYYPEIMRAIMLFSQELRRQETSYQLQHQEEYYNSYNFQHEEVRLNYDQKMRYHEIVYDQGGNNGFHATEKSAYYHHDERNPNFYKPSGKLQELMWEEEEEIRLRYERHKRYLEGLVDDQERDHKYGFDSTKENSASDLWNPKSHVPGTTRVFLSQWEEEEEEELCLNYEGYARYLGEELDQWDYEIDDILFAPYPVLVDPNLPNTGVESVLNESMDQNLSKAKMEIRSNSKYDSSDQGDQYTSSSIDVEEVSHKFMARLDRHNYVDPRKLRKHRCRR